MKPNKERLVQIKVVVVLLLIGFAINLPGAEAGTALQPGLRDSTPGVQKVNDFIIYEDPDFYSSFPSVIKKEDGEIMVAFRRAPDRRIFREERSTHVDPNSYLVTVSSYDDGKTWTNDPELLYAHPFGGSQDPCLLQLKDGTILCTSYGWAFVRPDGMENLRKPYFENTKGSVFLGGYYLRSTDGGDTWQGPVYPPNIPPEVKYSALGDPLPAYNRGALWEGNGGRLFWVVAAGDDPNNIRKTSAHLLISDDKGETWQYSSPVAKDDNISFNETSVYETPKGDLVAFIRTSGLDDLTVVARSGDGGKSFEPWEKMGFRGHPLQALRLPDNRVFLVYGYRHKPYGIRARILNEEATDFDTAPEIIIRSDGGSADIGYPWAVMLDESQVLVTYYFNTENGTRYIAGTILEIE